MTDFAMNILPPRQQRSTRKRASEWNCRHSGEAGVEKGREVKKEKDKGKRHIGCLRGKLSRWEVENCLESADRRFLISRSYLTA